MSFDPENPEAFRIIMRRLRENKKAPLSSARALSRFNQYRKLYPDRTMARDENGQPRTISAATLKRFLDGGIPNNIDVLHDLYEYLLVDPVFKYAFTPTDLNAAQDTPRSVSSGEAMASALRRHFSEAPGQHLYKVDEALRKLEGKYIVYRKSWRLGVPEGMYQTSLMEIVYDRSGECVSETQAFGDIRFPSGEALDSYGHTDRGFIFTFGPSIYFLTRQERDGSAVKLWVFAQLEPYDNRPVSTFSGVLYPSSSVALFDASPFFCQRVDHRGSFQGRYMSLAEIPDPRAKIVLTKQPPLRFG